MKPGCVVWRAAVFFFFSSEHSVKHCKINGTAVLKTFALLGESIWKSALACVDESTEQFSLV